MMDLEEVRKCIKNKGILFFDLDGTLVDTDEANFLAYKEAIKLVKGLDIDFPTNNRITQNNLHEFIPSLSKNEYKIIVKTKMYLYDKYIERTKVNSLSLKILEEFFQTNKIILVTNSTKKRAEKVLGYHNLLDKFFHKFFKEDYKDKEISKFEYALNHLNLKSSEITIFEDDEFEIKKIKSSNISFNNIINLK